jgi:hypothetical protein
MGDGWMRISLSQGALMGVSLATLLLLTFGRPLNRKQYWCLLAAFGVTLTWMIILSVSIQYTAK